MSGAVQAVPMPRVVVASPTDDVEALEVVADLLLRGETATPESSFYGRLCEAVCRMAAMDRAAIFLYDDALRRVRAVGTHGIALELFEDLHVTLEETPIAQLALSEDRVVEATGDDFSQQLPAIYSRSLADPRLACTPMRAAGRWPGVILSDREDVTPLTGPERHRLWTLGKIAALATSARFAT